MNLRSLAVTRRAPEAPPLPAGRTVGEHHAPDGGFHSPWPRHPEAEARPGGFFAWMWDRFGADLPPNPDPGEVPTGTPEPAYPHADVDELRLTFVGHATFLLQIGGLNLLTDPIWSARAGPFSLLGGPRLSDPGLSLSELPPLDGVLLSHGHYDHLDARTVRHLRDRFGNGLAWYVPLGYGPWLRRRGVRQVVELDWWHEVLVDGPGGPVRLVCLPVRHWTRRALGVNRELWGGWAALPAGSSDAARGVFFGGDSGYCPAFREIGSRLGPFRASILPIGAYEPRWFMAESHMNPREAVQAYRDLGAAGAFVGMHWGTFRLTDEDPLEPPALTRRAWREAGLPAANLHLPGIGGTIRL
ncbi:MAG: MBL fold metallo-hydrolase [Gemmatimonadota bacterium]|nr:MBL fold metallo-hydrolase [Gemmatimonadota bacterium]